MQLVSSAQSGSNPQVQPAPSTGGERAANLDNCIKILEALRYTAGGPIDLERLRVMRDFAKDIHDNNQGLRTFWISAAQLILINVLLPLLTAMLGYIFGRQSVQS